MTRAIETTVPILIALAALALLALGAIADDRRARIRRRARAAERDAARPLLHSINDDRCIGCEACVDACPTEVLDLVDHKVRVARFSDCVQCEQCAGACPTQALVMYRQGTVPRTLTVPEIDEQFQTAVPGQYLIGEVAGKPLVKNAANLGRAVIEHVARELAGRPASPGGDDVLDVAIVGSGPGGLSAGLTCQKHALSCLVFEKEHVIASTVARYPRGKQFMAEPSSARNLSYLPVFDATKEQLVAAWTELVHAAKLPVRLGEAVETVRRGDDGVFTIRTTVASYRARRVVFATGLRGKPRLLAVPGANLAKVQPLLDDPSEFAGEDVLVVGGGDSAVEGAIALAEVGARVTLSYRGDGFLRCKQANQTRLAECTAAGRLTTLLGSNVTQFTADAVTIACSDGRERTIANTRAFVLIGADTPVAWLEANHVRFVERPHRYALGSTEDAVRRFAPDAAECPRDPQEALAVVLGRPAVRTAARRMRSVAQHLRDEFREVVTSVTGVFRSLDLDLPPAPERNAPRRAGTRGRTVTDLVALPEGPPPLPQRRPAPRRTGAVTRSAAAPHDAVTRTVPALRALEAVPYAPPPGEPTDEIAALRRALDLPTDEIAALRRALDLPADDIAALRRAPDRPTGEPPGEPTDEIAALRRALDLPADEIAALRRALDRPPGESTGEIAALRAREARVSQIAALRRGEPADPRCADADDDARTREIVSLRARGARARRAP